MSNLYRFKALVSEPIEKISYRDAGLVAADNIADAMTKITKEFASEDNLIQVAIEPWGSSLTDFEILDEIKPGYYQERAWISPNPQLAL